VHCVVLGDQVEGAMEHEGGRAVEGLVGGETVEATAECAATASNAKQSTTNEEPPTVSLEVPPLLKDHNPNPSCKPEPMDVGQSFGD
jgi:hypothetical protein